MIVVPMIQIMSMQPSQEEADPSFPRVRVIRVSTGGALPWRRAQAEIKASLLIPPAPVKSPETLILDLADDEFEIVALTNMVLPLAERIRKGFHGPVRLVVATRDLGVGQFVDYLASKHSLAIFVSTGTSADALRRARPAGAMTATELVTMEAILRAEGPGITASALAERSGIELTAAGNRLVNLEKRGYVYRVRQPGREGDRFIDPRTAFLAPTTLAMDPTHQPTAPADVIPVLEQLQGALGTHSVARLLDVSPDVVSNWTARGYPITAEYAKRVIELHAVLVRALQVYQPQIVMDWLVGNEPLLNGERPIDVLASRGSAPLMEALAAIEAGAYA